MDPWMSGDLIYFASQLLLFVVQFPIGNKRINIIMFFNKKSMDCIALYMNQNGPAIIQLF
jgi:hypothetical protein